MSDWTCCVLVDPLCLSGLIVSLRTHCFLVDFFSGLAASSGLTVSQWAHNVSVDTLSLWTHCCFVDSPS